MGRYLVNDDDIEDWVSRLTVLHEKAVRLMDEENEMTLEYVINEMKLTIEHNLRRFAISE